MKDKINKMIEDKVKDINYNRKVFNFLETKEGIALFLKCYRILAPINIALLTSIFGLPLFEFVFTWIVVSMAVIGVGELLACLSVFLASGGFAKEERKKYFGNNFIKYFTLGSKKTRFNEMKEYKELIDRLEKELVDLRNTNKIAEKTDNYDNVFVVGDSKRQITPIDRSLEETSVAIPKLSRRKNEADK